MGQKFLWSPRSGRNVFKTCQFQSPRQVRYRLVFHGRTTRASTAPCISSKMRCPTHWATNCAPCQPLLRAFCGWIRSLPPTGPACNSYSIGSFNFRIESDTKKKRGKEEEGVEARSSQLREAHRSVQSSNKKQVLCINVQQFREGLVFKDHRMRATQI